MPHPIRFAGPGPAGVRRSQATPSHSQTSRAAGSLLPSLTTHTMRSRALSWTIEERSKGISLSCVTDGAGPSSANTPLDTDQVASGPTANHRLRWVSAAAAYRREGFAAVSGRSCCQRAPSQDHRSNSWLWPSPPWAKIADVLGSQVKSGSARGEGVFSGPRPPHTPEVGSKIQLSPTGADVPRPPIRTRRSRLLSNSMR